MCGDLPDAREAFLRCDFCRATNLVTPEIARERERMLNAEIEHYRARPPAFTMRRWSTPAWFRRAA